MREPRPLGLQQGELGALLSLNTAIISPGEDAVLPDDRGAEEVSDDQHPGRGPGRTPDQNQWIAGRRHCAVTESAIRRGIKPFNGRLAEIRQSVRLASRAVEDAPAGIESGAFELLLDPQQLVVLGEP